MAGFRSQGAAYWFTILPPVILIAEIDFACNIACPSLCQPGSCANAQCQPCRSASIGTGQQLSDGECSPVIDRRACFVKHEKVCISVPWSCMHCRKKVLFQRLPVHRLPVNPLSVHRLFGPSKTTIRNTDSPLRRFGVQTGKFVHYPSGPLNSTIGSAEHQIRCFRLQVGKFPQRER